MRHGKKFNHLSRKTAHRKALLKNLAKSLIMNKRITTTLPKAKALVKFIDPIITKSKVNTTHSRRVVFSYFQDKEPVKELFSNVSQKVFDRPGGYTRIIKLDERRLGDNAELAIIELVDFNTLLQKSPKTATKTRRSRSKRKGSQAPAATQEGKVSTSEENSSEKNEPKKLQEPNLATEETKVTEASTREATKPVEEKKLESTEDSKASQTEEASQKVEEEKSPEKAKSEENSQHTKDSEK